MKTTVRLLLGVSLVALVACTSTAVPPVAVIPQAAQPTPKLDFPQFRLPVGQVITQKISSLAMKRNASSIDKTVRPNGPVEVQRSFQSDQ